MRVHYRKWNTKPAKWWEGIVRSFYSFHLLHWLRLTATQMACSDILHSHFKSETVQRSLTGSCDGGKNLGFYVSHYQCQKHEI